MMALVLSIFANWGRSVGRGIWLITVLLFVGATTGSAQDAARRQPGASSVQAAAANPAPVAEGVAKESRRERLKREREEDRERSRQRKDAGEKIPAATSESAVSGLASADPAPGTDKRVTTFTMRQLGAWSALRLRGVDGSRVLAFNLRPNEYVISARLNVIYDYSPALLEDLSHFNILINERTAATEMLPRGKGVGVRRSIDINPRLFKANTNEIRFNLIGHYTRQCENPNHSSLWLIVSDLSTLELVIGTKPMEADLKFLPDPFLDRRESDVAQINMVLPNDPSMDMVRAAGIVASWFGTHAGSKGVKFVVQNNQLPMGNAIVFLSGQKPTAGYSGVAASALSVQRHPSDPTASVLLVNGGTDAELLRAARALAVNSLALVGPSVNLTKEVESEPRKPYDAPAWIRTDRPMKFGELVKADNLRVRSFYPEPIRVNYRVSPDVFTWRTDGAPLDVKYRATRLPTHRNSNLEISANGLLVDSIALNDATGATPTLSVTSAVNRSVSNAALHLPPYALGGRDQLQLTFAFDVQLQGECENLPVDNLSGAVDAESTLDFSKFPKFAALPNLQYFAQIGFPYTRLADLSETAFILPEKPSVAELSLYLTLLGKMGESSGFPALKHAVGTSSSVAQHADRDLIVVGSGANQPLFATWSASLPMVVDGTSRRVRDPHVSWRPQFRWEQRDIDPLEPKAGEVTISALGGLVSVMAFESPLREKRSVVFFYSDKEADQLRNASAIVNPERTGAYRGDFVVVRDDGLAHARVSPTYFVGHIPLLTKLRWFLADNPLLVAATAAILAILAALVLYRPLRFLIEFQRSRRPFAFLLRKKKADGAA